MSAVDVRAHVREIRDAHDSRDDEKAHALEDTLYVNVLRAAAAGIDVREMASIALETQDLSFARACG